MNTLDFLNSNTLRNYPIKDNLGRVCTDGSYVIPNDLIADLMVCAPGGFDSVLYISRIVNYTDNITVEVKIVDETDALGTFVIPTTSPAYTDIDLVPTTAFPLAVGKLTVGYFDGSKAQPSGEFLFDSSNTQLLMRVFTPLSTGISYVRVTDQQGTQSTLTGIINFNAENNLRFRAVDNTIYLDAGEGLGLNQDCEEVGPPIRTINGVEPDAQGNFYFINNDCTTFDAIEYGLLMKDTCGKPCLGCSEISTLTDRLILVENDLLKLRDYVTGLNSSIDQLNTTLNFKCDCG